MAAQVSKYSWRKGSRFWLFRASVALRVNMAAANSALQREPLLVVLEETGNEQEKLCAKRAKLRVAGT